MSPFELHKYKYGLVILYHNKLTIPHLPGRIGSFKVVADRGFERYW